MIDQLNKEQLEAVETEESNVIVLAAPGSGKTFTLINAAIEYRHSYPGATIDIITYTRAATQELRERLAESGIYDVNISTIHVWAREHLHILDEMYGFHMKILEQPAIMSILKTLIAEHRTKIKPEILYTYVTGNKKLDVTDSYRRTLETLNMKYIDYKRNNSLYDFTDFPLYLLDKLKQYNEKIYTTDALFVDELQDVDEHQYELFNRVEASKKFFIGDAQQAIYIFRGADMEIFNKLENFEYKTLKVNYRSYQEILDYARTFYKELEPRIGRVNSLLVCSVLKSEPGGIYCIRGKGGYVWVLDPFGNTTLIGMGPVDTYTTGINFLNRKPMILCRTNKQVKMLEELGWKEASTVHQAKGLEYDNVISIDMAIDDKEDLNIAYVAATRARNNLLVANFQQLYKLIILWKQKH